MRATNMSYEATIDKERVLTLPLCLYEGEVELIDTPDRVEGALRRFEGLPFVGFDTETRPSFKKGVVNPVSLLQLASENYAALFRLNKIGLPKVVVDFFTEPSVIKVGVGIGDDLRALTKLQPFMPASFVDLQDIAPKFGIEEKSLSKLMAIIFGVHISKRQRVTNWGCMTLTEKQIRYAATDAWCAWRMYDRLTQ